jgi:hypothetical protein
MAAGFRFDRRKTLEALVYIANRESRVLWALKVLFFADKAHLQKYGRLITNDWYVKLVLGPVPSNAYDLIKVARGDPKFAPDSLVSAALSATKYELLPKRKAELAYLSESDRECLDLALSQVSPLTLDALNKKTHSEPAYLEAALKKPLSLETLVRSLPNGDSVWDYMADC